MQWISKKAPIYIFLTDTWLRKKDGKIFKPMQDWWESEDGEKVPFTKMSKNWQKWMR